MLQYEQEAWDGGLRVVAGVDEAGRGPLAGPVVAAAVVFDPDCAKREADGLFRGLTDSKKLTAVSRDMFFGLLSNSSHIAVGIASADVAEIDHLNILRATHLAMARALDRVGRDIQLALIDGRPVRGLSCDSRAIVRGDAASLSIAAASVMAKVARDRMMLELDERYPQYGFARHKGYGTAAHLAALREHGPCPEHRRSFQPVRQVLVDS